MMLAGIRTRDQMFTTIFKVAKRLTIRLGKPGHAQLFLLQHALIAERPAHIRRNHAHLPLIHLQILRQCCTNQMRHLGGADHHQLIGLMIPIGEYSFTLERHHTLTRKTHLSMNHNLSLCSKCIKILINRQRHEGVVFPLLMHQIICGLHRSDDIRIRWQLLILHLHGFEQVFSFSTRWRKPHDNRLTHKAHFISRQRRMC